MKEVRICADKKIWTVIKIETIFRKFQNLAKIWKINKSGDIFLKSNRKRRQRGRGLSFRDSPDNLASSSQNYAVREMPTWEEYALNRTHYLT